GWLTLGPMLLSAACALVALGIFTQFASPMNDTFVGSSDMHQMAVEGVNLVNVQSFGVAEVIVQVVLLMSMVLLLVRSWTLPFGALTLLIGLPSITQLLMVNNYWLIVPVIATGLCADTFMLRLRLVAGGNPLYVFAAVVAGLYEASILLTTALTGKLGLSVNLIGGSVLYAAATGLFLAFLLDWPVRRQVRLVEVELAAGNEKGHEETSRPVTYLRLRPDLRDDLRAEGL
ncbi:MAG TPA: hypothetical protein VGQ96_06355, partial [Candidatus Eremiobacteraceae bacterium]|nr:hypothetical protein [Candidatus Eremiobacteraceae bacterium]